MKTNTIECLKKIFARLTESRVFNLGCKPGIKVTLLRWATVIAYGVLAGLLVHLFFILLVQILPAWFFSFKFPPSISIAFHIAYGFIAALSVIHIQDRYYLRFRRLNSCVNIGATLLYPTLHFSVLFGLLTLVAIVLSTPELNVFLIQSPLVILTVTFAAVYAVIQIVRNEKLNSDRTKKEGFKETKIIDLLTCDDEAFEDWIMKDESATRVDFFDRSPYVERIKDRLESSGAGKRGQVLLGEFGSGKTSIINYLKSSLDQEEWIISEFDSWQRASKPEDLVRLIMEQVIHDVGQVIEATSIENIPDSFVDALYGTHHWFKVASGLLKPKQPEDVLSRLDSLLKIHNKKLLIVIENIDRNEHPEHLVNTMAGMLDKLPSKNANGENKGGNINFIFSGDKEKIPLDTVYRISDYKEHVETVTPPKLILRFMAHCIDKGLSGRVNGIVRILPEIPKGGSVPEASLDRIEFIKKYYDLSNHPDYSPAHAYQEFPVTTQVLFAISSRLSNPRVLKYILRRVHNIWCSLLSGEVNLFDLIVYEVCQNDGEISERIKQLVNDGVEEVKDDPFSFEIRQGWSKDDGKKIEKETFDSSPIDKISCYLLNLKLSDGQNLRSIYNQSIVVEGGENSDDYSKYRFIVNRGDFLDSLPRDQHFLRSLERMVDGDGQGLSEILNDTLLDLKSGYIFDLLKITIKNYWQSLDSFLAVVNQLIIYDKSTDTSVYRDFRGRLFDALFSTYPILTKPSTDFVGDPYEEYNEFRRRIYETLKKSLTVCHERKNYKLISETLYNLIIRSNNSGFESIVEPLIRIYYSPDMTEEWAASERRFSQKNTLYLFYNIVNFLERNGDNRRRIDTNLWLLICESLLKVASLNVSTGRYSSFEYFFNGFGDDVRGGLKSKASQEGVKENLSIEALEVLNFLEENYPVQADKSQ